MTTISLCCTQLLIMIKLLFFDKQAMVRYILIKRAIDQCMQVVYKGKSKGIARKRENTKDCSLPHLNSTQSTKSIKDTDLSAMYMLTYNDKLITKELIND